MFHRVKFSVENAKQMRQTALMTDLTKIALVTGASRGLGYATALQLSDAGYHIIAVARTMGGLEELADLIEANGKTITVAAMDITNEQNLQQLCLSIFERWGHLDLLVHCAVNAPLLTPATQISAKDFETVFNTNTRATSRIIALTESLLRVAPDGKAVFINDPRDGEKFFGAYAASKAAANSLVESWIAETKNLKPTVSLFTPNPMPTATRARFFPGEDKSNLSSAKAEAKRLIASIS